MNSGDSKNINKPKYLSESETSKLVNESHLANHFVPFKFTGFDVFVAREIDPAYTAMV